MGKRVGSVVGSDVRLVLGFAVSISVGAASAGVMVGPAEEDASLLLGGAVGSKDPKFTTAIRS